MAYMSQERKKEIANSVKTLLNEKYKKYNVKCSFSVNHHSTLVCKIKSASFDLLSEFIDSFEPPTVNDKWLEMVKRDRIYDVNVYQLNRGSSDIGTESVARNIVKDIHNCMMVGNFDESDSMTDYFHVGWYTDLTIGSFGSPFQVV